MTIITVLHNKLSRLCKVITRQPSAEVTVTNYDKATNFWVEQSSISGIKEFSTLLSKLQSDPHRLIIRGAPHPASDLSMPVRRKGYVPSAESINDAPFQDTPQPWLMLDIDKLKLPETFDINKDPQKAITYAIAQLPKEFHNASVHWQLSASAGLRDAGYISAHLFYWLTEPVSSQRLKQWGKAINESMGSKLIDTALFQAVQIHYTAGPIFQEMPDPFGMV
jgi:hypothetical protein